jgi:hypothetical protein
MDSAKYLTGNLDTETRKIIDSILLENKYFPSIKSKEIVDTPIILYCGFTYLLDYKLTGKDRTRIQYINTSSRTPNNILYLTSILDREISRIQLKKIDSFNIDQYIDTLKKISSTDLPPPPRIPTPLKNIKFIPPRPK